MNLFPSAIIFFAIGLASFVQGFSKYGRTCKDIGCLSNEQCVMETDPCSYYQRDNECGSYPTCKRTNSNSQKSCSTFICPPGNVCKMIGSNPKCVDDPVKRGHIGYDTSAIDNPQNNNNPSAPSSGSQQPIYPNLPRGGETTPRPNVAPPNNYGGQGYRGGQIGSGYPGQPSAPAYGGYPQHGGGYPQQGGGYQQPYYPQPPSGYPGYQQPNYNGGGGYNQQPNYNTNYNQNRYGQKSSGSSISDQLTNTLKNLGTDLLKNALGKLISGATARN